MQTWCNVGDELFVKGTICRIEIDEDNCVTYKIKIETERSSPVTLWANASELFVDALEKLHYIKEGIE